MKAGESRETDYLVIGCGIAGLRAAMELAAAGKVLVLSKAELSESATQYAQGGIAAALSDEDEVGLHYQDTLKAGDGLCNEAAVRLLVEEGPRYIQELIEWGTAFDREGTRLAFTREGAHSRSRVLHAHGDSTGREIARALFARARDRVELAPFVFTTDLLVEDGRVSGVRALDEQRHSLVEIRARAVLLATGGLGQVYAETTNPAVATGDGVAIAYRAGVVLQDMEFVQFHPTALYTADAPRFLLSEALRGEGGCLRNVDLERFLPHYHEAGDLAPRDIVSRAIMTELERTGAECVYLDLTGLDPEHVRARFPRIHRTCLEYNLDVTTDLIPVRPAAHYAMGGVATDLEGRTSLPGLFAAGEVACNGVHGANRLASNSLLEGLVFGARAGQAMAHEQVAGRKRPAGHPGRGEAASPNQASVASGTQNLSKDNAKRRVAGIRAVMWDKVGIIRRAATLQAGLEALARVPRPLPLSPGRADYEESNLRTVGEVIARCALAREESRGAHYRTDFPFKDDERWGKHSHIAPDQPVSFA
ncbi:MAG: L-aspartate oxidase [Acidobacteria bacterium]|nr:L-aspartate oxidase [Acidobacteriota bacterium]